MTAPNSSPIPPLGRRSPTPNAIAPDGSEIRLLVDTGQGATKSSLVEVTLPAGQTTRPIWHRTVEEVWYVLEGTGKVWRCPPDTPTASAPPVNVIPGDSLTVPTNWRFQFAANPNAPLRFLCHTTPPWPGEYEAVPAEQGGLGEATV
ncbi:MAG: cupin domain-containing protein [Chloroflexi bacterium]|nr:cupin domain-containing protein [Chloroflexota bacterium]MDA1271756.1 cupin domain-containing protein [Chloroflexota bacterium]